MIARPPARRVAWQPLDYLRRYPRLCAHVICHSLGYATPLTAARILRHADRDEPEWCEWIDACYARDPKPAVRQAVAGRHSHQGYMAHYPHAIALVRGVIANGEQPLGMLASWF